VYAISLQNNNLIGQLPQTLNISTLQFLYLSNNKLSGTIPDFFGGFSDSLQQLGFDVNQFSGIIPSSLGNCQNLQNLFLQKNRLTGGLDAIGTLTSLQLAYLSVNKISGTVPQGLTSAANLQQLGLDSNKLTGTMPSGFSSSLTSLFIQNNVLTGPFDSSLCQVQTCDGRGNQFQCPIPQSCCQITSCKKNI